MPEEPFTDEEILAAYAASLSQVVAMALAEFRVLCQLLDEKRVVSSSELGEARKAFPQAEFEKLVADLRGVALNQASQILQQKRGKKTVQ